MDYNSKSKEELIRELIKLKEENYSLQATLETNDVESLRFELVLRERLKELNCHYRMTEVLSNSALSMDEICENMVLIIPEAFYFSDMAEASIVINSKTFKTPGYKKSHHSLIHRFETNYILGNIEVVYLDDQIPEADPLFLPEETDLLFTIGERLCGIIERRASEKALNESEEEFRNLIESLTDVVYRVDTSGVIKYISPTIKKILGYVPKEVIGRNFLEFVGENQEFLKKRFITLSETHEIENEYLIKNKFGENRWIRLSTKANFKNGSFLGGTGTLVDITERKIMEEKLRKSEETFRNLVERITDVIYEISMDGKIIYISPIIEKLVGFTPEELIGKNFLDFVYEPDKKILIERLLLEDQVDHPLVEYRYLNKNGELRWVSTSATSLLQNGEVVGKSGTIVDITDKKNADEQIKLQNERLMAIMKAMPDLIFIMDKEGHYLEYFADNIDELVVPKDQLVGMNMRELFDEDISNLHINKIRECVETKKMITYDYSIIFKEMPIFYEVRLILLSDDKVFRFVRDITIRKNAENKIIDLNLNLENKIKERTAQLAQTNNDLIWEIEERKRAEEDLKKARIEAENANLAKSEFLSRMSHELRTPMNSILGFAQLLYMGDLHPKQKKSVRHILRSGQILLDLINEVLDISRIEAGHLYLSMEPVLMKDIVREMIDVVYPLATKNKIKIKVTELCNNKFYVNADKQRLKQVLLNLLTNSIKYSRSGGKVTICTDLIQKNDMPLIRVSITDNGSGISPEDLKKIFTPFERLGAEKTETEGSGLGLTVVKKLIEAMGGHIGAESIKETGSTFWFELPQDECKLVNIDQATLSEMSSSLSSKKGKILYIEDTISNIELVEQIIASQRSGIKLVTSMNGKDVVKLVSEIVPDLILLDLNLADTYGSEVISRILAEEKTREIPIVVVSADAMPIQLERILKLGVRKYLTKPLNIVEFLKVIDEYI